MPKKKSTKAPKIETLLVELLTEELPPKALSTFDLNFSSSIFDELKNLGLVAPSVSLRSFATPRRLAVVIPRVHDIQPVQQIKRKGPAVNAAFDVKGDPSPALLGFAKSCGVSLGALQRVKDAKGEYFLFHGTKAGEPLELHLAGIVQRALKKLPIPKTMRWGANDVEFVRPLHGLVMMHGKKVVPGTVLGRHSEKSGTRTYGHRFMGKGEIVLKSASEYEARLRKDGMVVANFAMRKSEIEKGLRTNATKLGASIELTEDVVSLIDEVTGLVEYPNIYNGEFDHMFLEVPQECLILTMQRNQKYFPLFSRDEKLLPRFLVVGNIRTPNPGPIVSGNERVLRARLSDAKFFFDQDRKERLEARVPRLAQVVYHNKLGSQLERVEHIQLLAGRIARDLGADTMLAERAAWLSKADLLTGMVGEFPELQGTMGRYYALHDGEPKEAADAIEAHYRPRFAGDSLPQGPVASSVALADKLNTLAGLFGIGQQPTGEKDPFGLRRAALGVIRIVVEHQLPLSLHELVNTAFATYNGKIGDAHLDLETFVFDRFSGYLKELGFSTLEIDAVLSPRPVQLSQVPRQLEAVRAFQALPEAETLAAANKRVVNILKQAAAKGESFRKTDRDVLKEPAEIALYDALNTASIKANALFERGDYSGYLKTFAVLKTPVDAFFDSVMVMVEQETLRKNRLALLTDLREAMNRVADISRLAK